MNSDSIPDPHTSRLIIDTVPDGVDLSRLLRSRGLNLYYGDLHNHTSWSDGVGLPVDALSQMRERGLHFAAITDHGEFFDRHTPRHNAENWTALAELTTAMTDAEFVALRGFEWSSPSQGHSNVWWSEEFTGYLRTGDETMESYYRWLKDATPIAGRRVLAGFNHPGREPICFDGCFYVPHLDNRIVTLECFNREDDFGMKYMEALDRGWHVGAIGVSDHHGDDWGSPRLPRAGLLAPSLSRASIEDALFHRRVFATRSPSLRLLIAVGPALMGSRLRLEPNEALEIDIWCDDPEASQDWTRLEVWTSGASLVAAWEMRGLHAVSRSVGILPQGEDEQWFFARVLRAGYPVAYSSPIWARWGGLEDN